MNIGVIFGGRSVEHDISIITALQVINNLDKEKYKVIPLYLDHNNKLYVSSKLKKIDTFKKPLKLKAQFTIINTKGPRIININRKFQFGKKIDLIFNCTHGFGTEDGIISSWLNMLDIPNTSCNLLSGSICQDKEFTKIIMREINVPVLECLTIKEDDRLNIDEIIKSIEYPVIIKPAHLGSSIGIYKANNKEELLERIKQAFIYDDKIIIERYLKDFKEFAVSAYKRKKDIIVSKIEQIDSTNEIFDFDDKYINHHKLIKHTFLENQDLINLLTTYVKKAYNKLELKGVVRFDFLMENKEVYLNEINTIPGSLANYLYKDQMTFKLLLDEQIRQTFYEHQNNKKYLKVFNSSILNTDIKFKK